MGICLPVGLTADIQPIGICLCNPAGVGKQISQPLRPTAVPCGARSSASRLQHGAGSGGPGCTCVSCPRGVPVCCNFGCQSRCCQRGRFSAHVNICDTGGRLPSDSISCDVLKKQGTILEGKSPDGQRAPGGQPPGANRQCPLASAKRASCYCAKACCPMLRVLGPGLIPTPTAG